MKVLVPFVIVSLLIGTGCGPTDTPSTKLAPPPASLDEKVKRIEQQANLSEDQKAAAIAILKQQEQQKSPAQRPPSSN